jgi:hypothetical protein
MLGVNPTDTSAAHSGIFGDGILTDLTAAEPLDIPTPSNGGQWFLVVLNRKWAARSSTFMVRNGALTSATDAGRLVPSYPGTLITNPGTESDLPVAWVWATTASLALTIVPLLTPSRAAAARAGDAAARAAVLGTVFPTNGNAAALAKFGEIAGEWYNPGGNWTERYYGPRDAVAGSAVDVARPGGWYPVHGQLPSIDFAHDADYDANVASSSDETTLVGFSATGRNYWGSGGQGEPNLGLGYAGNGLWNIGQPGRWRLTAVGSYRASGSNGGRRGFGARSAARGLIAFDRRSPSSVPWINIAADWVVPAGGDTLSLVASQDNGTTLTFHVFGAHLQYVGPN